jgi:DNA polymerase III epsilon subunit family exonuclease
MLSFLDLETTGVHNRDRVIEIGMVRLDGSGEVLEEFETLVDPGRTVTNSTSYHGITDADLIDAPRFQEIVGDLAYLMDGAIWVAHNAPFDLRFLRNEFSAAGESLPSWPTLCTMRLSGYIGGPTRPTLKDCCHAFNVEFEWQEHRALHDAKAAARALMGMLQIFRSRSFQELLVCDDEPWFAPLPALNVSSAPSARRHVRGTKPAERKLVVTTESAQMSEAEGLERYQEALIRSLEDRLITEEEFDELTKIIDEFGISASQAHEVHVNYFRRAAEMALFDGVLGATEQRDLERVAELLNLEQETVERVLGEAEIGNQDSLRIDDFAGKSVCFTGEIDATSNGVRLSRSDAEAAARKIGMIPMPRVTKKLDILVVTDPHSMSGKAKAARRYGVRIMTADAFLAAIGFPVD